MPQVLGAALSVPAVTPTIAIPQERHRPQLADLIATAINIPRSLATVRVPQWHLPDIRVAMEDDRVLACAAEHGFDQWFGGRAVPCSGIWAVATLPEARSAGLASACVRAVIDAAVERGAVISALYPAVLGPYRRLGFELAGAHESHQVDLDAIPAVGAETPPVELAEADRDLEGIRSAYREWIRTENGPVEPRREAFWNGRLLGHPLDESFRAVVVREDGRVTGFAAFTRTTLTPGDVEYGIDCEMLFAISDPARRALTAYFRGHRGLGRWLRWEGPSADAFGLVLENGQLEHPSRLDWMLALLNVPSALAARGWPQGSADVTLAVDDPERPANEGPWRLRHDDGRIEVTPAHRHDRRPVPVRILASMYSGYLSPADAVRLGWLDADDPFVEAAGRLWRGPDPWSPIFF